MFAHWPDEEVNIEMISTSTIRISLVIAASDLEKAARCCTRHSVSTAVRRTPAPLPERK